MIDNLKVILFPLNDKKFPLSFFNLNLSKSLLCIMYHGKPTLNFSIYFYPGSTSTIVFWTIPLRFPLKNFPWAISHSREMLSKDRRSTGLDDRLHFSHNVTALNPKISLNNHCGEKWKTILDWKFQWYYLKLKCLVWLWRDN